MTEIVRVRCPHRIGLCYRERDLLRLLPCDCNEPSEVLDVVASTDNARLAARGNNTTHETAYPRVQGRCPTCGARSLFLGEGGYVTCSILACTRPDHATDVLEGDRDQ